MPPERRTPKRPTVPSLLPIRLSLIMLVNYPCSELMEYVDGRPARGSGRAHRVEELVDLDLETVAVTRQRLCGRENLGGGRAGLGGTALHVGDVGGDLLGAVGGLLHVAGDFLGRGPLLFHRGGNRRGDLGQLLDGAADLLD